MKLDCLLESSIDSLTPALASRDMHARKQVRMFLISHMFGPLLGLPIPLVLFLTDPQPSPHIPVLAVSIVAFWGFLPLIRLFPRQYPTLALASITNLNFAVLWGAYHYGGASSPFLLWYSLIPLLAFFYLGGSRRAQTLIFGQIIFGLGTFAMAYVFGNESFPHHLPVEDMARMGILSAFCSTTYAFFMASYYSRVVDSQSELMKEVKRHERTLEMLVASKDEVERAKNLAEARNEELETAKARLEHNALHDALTGLPNRRYLDKFMVRHAESCAMNGKAVVLLHIDLDRFKQINDTLGHIAGDAMLVHVAKLLRDTIGPDEFIARVGGDEFAVICQSRSSREAVAALADDIIARLSRPVPYRNHLCRFGACIGIAIEQGKDIRPERLLVNSDIALYRAKAHGRNRAEFFSEELQAHVVHTNRVADDLLRGLEEGEFVAHYQPQMDAQTLEVVGVEALVRWNHPTEGMLSPGAFLHVAEELNAVATLDRQVLQRALADMRELAQSGVDIGKLSVNVSAKRLNDENLAESLRGLDFKPGALAFELVESIFLDDTDSAIEANIDAIKRSGIDIEIDDFGTGHASIVSLLKLSPKRLKIDRQFIRPISESPDHSRLVRSIIEMGKSLGIGVVAEGVETMDQALRLRELGCDVLQGYAFARPMPLDELAEFVSRRACARAS